MDFWKILLVTMLAFGFALVESFHVGDELNHEDEKYGPESNECSFCYYYYQTGHSPYEVLWKLGTEVRSKMSLQSQILTLLDPRRLEIAEYFFHDYCYKTCEKRGRDFRRANSVTLPCQNENGLIDYE